MPCFSSGQTTFLSNQPQKTQLINYEIVTKPNHEEEYQSYTVEIKPLLHLPLLLELLDRQKHPEHDTIRFKLLKWMIEPIRLRNFDLSTFPVRYLQDILTLVVLRSHNYIDQFEADLILLTIKHVELNTVPENIAAPSVLLGKAVRTSFLFSKFHMILDRCFQVTGLRGIAVIYLIKLEKLF